MQISSIAAGTHKIAQTMQLQKERILNTIFKSILNNPEIIL